MRACSTRPTSISSDTDSRRSRFEPEAARQHRRPVLAMLDEADQHMPQPAVARHRNVVDLEAPAAHVAAAMHAGDVEAGMKRRLERPALRMLVDARDDLGPELLAREMQLPLVALCGVQDR